APLGHSTARLSQCAGCALRFDAIGAGHRLRGRFGSAADRPTAARDCEGTVMTDLAAPSTLSRHRASLTLKAGIALVGLHVVIGLLTLAWLPYDPNAFVGGRLEGASLLHWVGTDRLGRDLFTQLMIGSRIALMVGTGAVAIGAA